MFVIVIVMVELFIVLLFVDMIRSCILVGIEVGIFVWLGYGIWLSSSIFVVFFFFCMMLRNIEGSLILILFVGFLRLSVIEIVFDVIWEMFVLKLKSIKV